jgi:SAM-dependent methyltransferase
VGQRFAIDIDEVRDRVRQSSPLSPDSTARILKAHFTSPRVIIPYLGARYSFAQKKVLEIGSSFGMHLFYWGPGSQGVEAREDAAAFTTALGFQTHRMNVEDELGTLPAGSFEAIHTNALFEHLVAPHLFLARCYRLLAADGILAIGHPVVPPTLTKWAWSALDLAGWNAVEHVNFFTPMTARLTLERAGFEVLEQLSPGPLRVHPFVARTTTGISASLYSICRKRPNYRYEKKRIAAFDPASCRDDLHVFRDEGPA